MDKRIKLLALAVIPSAALLLLPGCGGDSSDQNKPAAEAAAPESTTQPALDQVEAHMEAAGKAVDQAEEDAKEMMDKAEDKAAEAMDTMEEKADEAMDTMEEKADDMHEAAGDMLGKMGEK
ncbi:MAG: hypothetical protein R3E57_08775 [Porticoccaceae bacterium]